MKNILNRLRTSIRLKIVFGFFLISVFSLITTTIFSTGMVRNLISSSIEPQIYQTLIQEQSTIDYHIKVIQDLSDTIYIDMTNETKIYDFLNTKALANDYDYYMNITGKLNSYYQATPYIDSITIVTSNDITISAGNIHRLYMKSLESEPWYSTVASGSGKATWLFDARYVEDGPSIPLSYVRTLKSTYHGDFLGLMIISVDTDLFSNVLGASDVNFANDYAITDRTGQIVYSTDPFSSLIPFIEDEIYEVLADSPATVAQNTNRASDEMVTYIHLNQVDWSLFCLTSMTAVNQQLAGSTAKMILIAILVFFVTVGILIQLTNRYLKPIGKLTSFIHNMTENEALDGRIELTGTDEVYTLGKNFNYMLDKVQSLMKKTEEDHEIKRRLEIEALQAQINPHFLYNTLSSINCIAKINAQENISEMTIALSDLLRLSMDHSKQFITLAQEKQYLENYMTIQNYRYVGMLNFQFTMTEEVSEHLLPKFILQPLVENAIKYGLHSQIKEIEVIINAALDNENLIIIVKDNGPGMADEMMRQLNTLQIVDYNGNGIGIKNTMKRLQLYFGPGATLRYIQCETGTTVHLVIPDQQRSPQ